MRAWKRTSDKLNKAKTLGFKMWMMYNLHLLRICFNLLAYRVDYRRWCVIRSVKVKAVVRIHAKRTSMSTWRGRAGDSLKKKNMRKCLKGWQRNMIGPRFRAWRITTLKILGWMLHLCFRKWCRETRRVLVFRARWRARKNVTLKRAVTGGFKAHAAGNFGVKRRAMSCFVDFSKRLTGSAFLHLRLVCKALAVAELAERACKVRIIKAMRNKLAVTAILERHLLSGMFGSWKKLMRVRAGLAAFRRLYTAWRVERILEEWRTYAFTRVLARVHHGRALNR